MTRGQGATPGVEIIKAETPALIDAFMRVPELTFRGDPTWVPPLFLMERRRLTPGKNPFFEFGEAAFFIAYRNGAPVGRVSAQVNRLHQERHKDGAGHFGFFDCIDDQEAANALVAAAAAWLKERGCLKMLGPMNLSINEESGLQIDGFESPPAVFMTQSRPWMAALLEGAGLAKEMDLYAYRMNPAAAAPKLARLADLAQTSGRVTLRPFDMKKFRPELELVVEIFNDAWKDNWGFVPISADEMEMVVGELRYFFSGNFVRFVYLDGQPVGVMVVLPDYNAIIKDYGGKLFPLNWARLVWNLWRQKITSARVVLLGLRGGARGGTMGAGALAMLVNEFIAEGRKYPFEWVEFSWILETNRPMRAIAELVAGKPAKTYRVYARTL